jgi:SAM-dependent methyltransferase
MRSSDEPGQTQKVAPAEGFDYYRPAVYWNSYPSVVEMLNERATGDVATWWGSHLRDAFGPFRHALILNCGNGWVERALIEQKIVESAVGVDISDELLAIARIKAETDGLPLRYHQLDVNTAEFPVEEFDLVVNHAALHHVAYIDRVSRRICELLPPHGVFVSWDYIGPHRNQYPGGMWEDAWRVNENLPPEARQVMAYPHLPTIMATDPTEAIHSELVSCSIERYFRIEHRRDLGGGIAYLLLTHNHHLHDLPNDVSEPIVRTVMNADFDLLAGDPASTLFTYIVARPKHETLTATEQLSHWTESEDERERLAAASGGIYYPRTAVASLSEQVAALGGGTLDERTASVLARVPGTMLVRTLIVRLKARFYPPRSLRRAARGLGLPGQARNRSLSPDLS